MLCVLLYTENGFATEPVILNGQTQHDIEGNPIHAHGGGFIKYGDTYYWFGEDKSHNSHHFKAVNCYSSKDLTNWTFRNAVLTQASHPDLNKSDRVIERPKIIYNETTNEFVMWMHWDSSDYGVSEYGVAKCATIDGDYQLVAHHRPENNMSRDCTLFKDDNGKAFFISAANHNSELIIYELTDDYLDIKKQVLTLWPGKYREAPALIKKDDTYYLISSGATGWEPNQAKYATAPFIEGPWSQLNNIGDHITFDSQSTYIIPIIGSVDTTYIFCADRWQDPDLQNSKYIWLPLTLNDTQASLTWFETWQINTTTGKWGNGTSVLKNDIGIQTNDFLLHQNYPNPFNFSTHIEYSLKNSTRVLITIYDILGNKVRTLVNRELDAGHYNILWDGSNNENIQMAAGLYFCKMKSDDFVKMIKLVMMK